MTNQNYQAASMTGTLVILKRPTDIAYTGDTIIANDGATILSGMLTDVTTSTPTPIANRSVTLTLGTGPSAQSCNAMTDGNGLARCIVSTVNQPLGPGNVSAAFTNDANYLPASANAATLIFAYPAGGGNFVIGDLNAVVGGSATFWGAQWWELNSLSDGPAPDSFKGFVNRGSTPPSCGSTWATDPGNSSGPPNSIPSYMAVIVSSSIAKSGEIISGNIRQIAIVRTDAGYAPNTGHAGTGTVVALLRCNNQASAQFEAGPYDWQYNPSFLLNQYFGYLGRNRQDSPDANMDLFNFWLSKRGQSHTAG
jgi:hypothetical protein